MKNLPNGKGLRFSFRKYSSSGVDAEVLEVMKRGGQTAEVNEVVVQMVVVLAAGWGRTAASLPAGWLGCWRRTSEKRLLPSALGHLCQLSCSLGVFW